MSQFQPSPVLRLANKMVTRLMRWGLPLGVRRAPMALLTVPGRKSGIPRTTPVALADLEGVWILIAVYGVCDWSRNLEAAGRATVTLRGRETAVVARRLSREEAGPVLRAVIADAPAMIRRMTAPYFSVDGDSPLEDWGIESIEHPVFELIPDLD